MQYSWEGIERGSNHNTKILQKYSPLKDDFVILNKQLEDFRDVSINEVYLLTGYLSVAIESRYRDSWNGIATNYLVEQTPMETLWAVRNPFNKVKSDILLRN